MSADANKQLVEGFLRAFGDGNMDAVEEALAPDFVNHDAPEFPGVGGDRAGVVAAIRYLKAAFPDARADLVSVVAEGDKVGVHDQLVGTHEAEFLGVAPTGRQVRVDFIHVFRVVDGRIVERWGVSNSETLLRQLGVGRAVSEDRPAAEFLGMGIELSTDTFTAEEKARTLAWYREYHDHGDLDLAPFARFMIEHDATGFKRQRRHVIALGEPIEDASLPLAAALLMFIHTYIVLGMGKGALYEIVTVRDLSVTRAQALETIALAALHGGPRGINALAEVADDYLREWADRGDTGSDELLPGELELIRDWYRRTYGDVPAHVELLGRSAPSALKTQRARFETAIRGALPAQLIPLLTLHLSAVRLWPKPLRRAAQTARALGVQRGHVVAALLWAAVYGADVVMETALDAAGDVLDAWDDQA